MYYSSSHIAIEIVLKSKQTNKHKNSLDFCFAVFRVSCWPAFRAIKNYNYMTVIWIKLFQ